MKNIGKKLKLLISGAAAGLTNGLFGTGGGLILVPLLTGWAGLDEKNAFATSVTVIVPICVVSSAIYMRNGAVDFGTAMPYLAGGLLGGFLSAPVFKKISISWLNIMFSLLMLYGGIRLVMSA